MRLAALILLACVAAAEDLPPVSAATDYAHLHLGLNPPKLLHSKDPEYTPQAVAAGIEGSVVLQVVISAEGRVTNATVVSPLPAGLDRKALEVVKSWRYIPGVMDGERVPVLMTIEVLFKLPYEAEKQRQNAQAHAPRTAPAKGGDLRNTAFLGNAEAQQTLARRAEEAGNLNLAQWYWRLCAAHAVPVCEYQLGKVIVSAPGVTPNGFTEGVAWLELAKEHGDAAAARLWTESRDKLSSMQLDWVASLKPHLELRDVRGF